MLLVASISLIMGIAAGCEETHIQTQQTSFRLKEPITDSMPISDEIVVLSEQIKLLVKGLEYSDIVAEYFAQIVTGWNDKKGLPVLLAWKKQLINAKRECEQSKISKNQVARIEESVIGELRRRTCDEISYAENIFELADILKRRQANCFGYTQLIYITGNAIGLSVRPFDVLEGDMLEDRDVGHSACFIDLSDGRTTLVDLAVFPDLPSMTFKLESQFVENGNYWEPRNQEHPSRIYSRIQILEPNEVTAHIYLDRGIKYAELGQHAEAISSYNRAIELYPMFAGAYSSRGNVHVAKGEHDRAILDFTRAIETDPLFAMAYYNRGNSYIDKRKHDQAISDYTKAIEIDPTYASAYVNRGIAHAANGEHDQAILDYTKAIEIEPRSAKAYYNRGNSYRFKSLLDQAILDYTKAIEIEPRFLEAFRSRAIMYFLKGKHEKAWRDFDTVKSMNH